MILCHVTCLQVGVLTWVQHLGDAVPLKFCRAKTFKIWCDLGQLSCLTANISGTHKNIDKKSTTLLSAIHPALNTKKIVNFGPLTKKLQVLTHPISTLCVLRILMHLSSGHVTLPLGEFYNLQISSPNRIQGAGRTRVGLCPKFLVQSYIARRLQETKFELLNFCQFLFL